MGRDPVALVRAFLAEHNPPLRIWLAPAAAVEIGHALVGALPAEAIVEEALRRDGAPGPAILLATAADLGGPQRAELLAAAHAALPGRPVISGGSANKDVLLDAMNTWRVFHLLRAHPSSEEIADAVLRAYRAAALEHAAVQCARELRARCVELKTVMDDLQATREQILHAERLTTVGSFCSALSTRLREHLERLRALDASLRALPDDPRRAELLDFTVENIHAIDVLLADLLARAEAGANQAPRANHHEDTSPRSPPHRTRSPRPHR